jgi:hypothetical protein
MSIDWFRSWHGAPTDSKWLLIAKRAGVAPGMVSAVVWALFDHASQNEHRGNVDNFDIETYAVFSGFDEANIAAIINALNEKGLIVSGTLTAWEKRQPKREDSSTERVREHRNAMKHNETQRNAREDKSRIDKKEDIRAVAKTTRPNADFEAFWEARPKRKGADPKDPARKLYEAAVKAGADPAGLLAALRRYAAIEAERVGTPYLPQMVKWLRDKRWLDYPEIAIQAPNEQTDWDAICSSFKKFGHWSRQGGNHPDSGSCRCPPEILAKYGIVSATGHDPPPAPSLRAMQ